MKIGTIVVALLVNMILIACVHPTKVAQPAENFAFVFQDIPCGSIPIFVLDTANNTLIYRELLPLEDASSTIISVHLTDKELELIYQKAIEIGFFDYPQEFVVPDDQIIGIHFPASSYQLSMTNGKMTNSVDWLDRDITKPDYKKADELRELMILIQDIIRLRPEVQQYGDPKAACA